MKKIDFLCAHTKNICAEIFVPIFELHQYLTYIVQEPLKRYFNLFFFFSVGIQHDSSTSRT